MADSVNLAELQPEELLTAAKGFQGQVEDLGTQLVALAEERAEERADLALTVGRIAHDIKNAITSVYGWALSILDNKAQFCVDYGVANLLQEYLDELEREGLTLPKDFKVPEDPMLEEPRIKVAKHDLTVNEYLSWLGALRAFELPEGYTIDDLLVPPHLRTMEGKFPRSAEELSYTQLGLDMRMLVDACSSVERAKDMLYEFMQYATARSGQKEYTVLRLDMVKVARDAVRKSRVEAYRKGLYLDLEVVQDGMPVKIGELEDPDLPSIWVRGDEAALEKAVTNLVQNAVLYTPEGGATVRVSMEDDSVLVQSIDTGVGIDAQDLPHIGRASYRTSQTRDTKGTGLGLATVVALVEDHGGSFDVHSEGVGKGSTFTVTLPGVKPCPVSLIKDGDEGNWYFVYGTDYKDTAKVDDLPLDIVVGATSEETFRPWIACLNAPSEFFARLQDEFRDKLDAIREQYIDPQVRVLEAKVSDALARHRNGTLYLLGMDPDLFKSAIVTMATRGMARPELDRAFEADAVSTPSGHESLKHTFDLGPKFPRMKFGQKWYFQWIGATTGEEAYVYPINGDIRGLRRVPSDAFFGATLEDLRVTLGDPQNYRTVQDFERNIAQKVLAIIYATREALMPEYAEACKITSTGLCSTKVYDIVQGEFEALGIG